MSLKNSREGRYVYCVVDSGERVDLGQIGIENGFVYTLPVKDIGAVVHRCQSKSYRTEDKEKAAEWFITHQYVIALATKQFGAVIPQTFNTILRGYDETVKNWLNRRYSQLRALFEKLEGKEQYEVQIFLENGFIRKIIQENKEIQRLGREIEKKTEGADFSFKKQREKRLGVIEDHARTLYDKIKAIVDEARFEPTNKRLPEKWRDKLMILNLSCLVNKGDVQRLGKMLAEVSGREGFAVRFTGPWPPYSFVGEIEGQRGRRRR